MVAAIICTSSFIKSSCVLARSSKDKPAWYDLASIPFCFNLLANCSVAFLLKQYNHTEQTNGNSASAAIKKRFGIKSHNFRHELISRLRDAECPIDIQSFITGHALNSSSKHYGDKHQLAAKYKWLDKVALVA